MLPNIFTINNIKYDISLYLTIYLIQNILERVIFKTALFDNRWISLVLSTILGVVIYNLFMKPLYNITENITNTSNNEKTKKTISRTLHDLIRFGTIFSVQNFASCWLLMKPFHFDYKLGVSSAISIFAFSMYNIIKYFFNDSPNMKFQLMMDDVYKVVFQIIILSYAMNGSILMYDIVSMIIIVLAVIAFHRYVKTCLIDNSQILIIPDKIEDIYVIKPRENNK